MVRDGLLYNKDMTELVAVPSGLPIKRFVVRDGVEVIGKGVLAGHKELEEVVYPLPLASLIRQFLSFVQ